MLIGVLPFSCIPDGRAYAAGTITGTVFQDFNSDGVFNTTSSVALPAVDVHLASVTVSAYDAAGTLQGTTTTVRCTGAATPAAVCTGADTGPNFSLTAGGTGPYRIEFTNFPTSFHPTLVGANNNTSVQFVADGASSGVSLGLNNPGDYCQSEPQLATTCFAAGDQITGTNQNSPAVVSFPYTASGQDPGLETLEARAHQVGGTWGLAYHRTSRSLFVAAYVKRGVGFGLGSGSATSDGTGTIYRVTPGGSPDGVPFVDLDDLFGANTAGADPHTDFEPLPPDFDSGAYDAVGKLALGDIDISEDDATLYAVNLADRMLYVLPVGLTPTAPTVGQVTRTSVPDPGCVNGVARPFGVKTHHGLVYVGGVCTAENGGGASDLLAYVYSFDPATATWSSSPVLQFPLNYPRGCADLGGTYGKLCYASSGTTGSLADWRPWRSTLDTTFPAGYDSGFTAHPQPMLTDLEFVGDDMVVGFRDRFADQIGVNDTGPDGAGVSGANLWSVPAGDLLRAGPNGSGGWTLESNAQSVPAGAFGLSAGANNEQGPGDGEFYHEDGLATVHDENGLGGIVQVPGFPEISLTAMDPIVIFAAGVHQLSNATGDRTRAYEVYPPGANFEKANGLGDMEALCDAAPIEIGNRVWNDGNGNGRQDPNESGINGVTVELYRNGVLAGSTTTATVSGQAGSYYFNIANVTLNGANGIVPGTGTPGGHSQYEIRIPNISGGGKQAALGALQLTIANVNPESGGDLRDSDGVTSGTNAIYVIPYANLGGPGFTNHTYDFGFTAITVGDVEVKARLFDSRSVERTDFTLCLSPFDFGFVVLQQGAPSAGQREEFARRHAKVRYLSVAEDLIPTQGYATLAATSVFRSNDGTCADRVAELPSDTRWPLAAWAILQDVGSGFFATELPTLSVEVDSTSGAVEQGAGLIPGGNTVIARFDVNPNVGGQTDIFVWLSENAGDTSGANRPSQLTAFLNCEDELEISTALNLIDEVNIINPDLLAGIGQCKQLQQYRGVLRFELPVAGFVWSHLTQAGQQYRSSFLGYNLECNSFVPTLAPTCRTAGYLLGDPAAAKLVPYYRVTSSLATIIGVENLIGNAGPEGTTP